MFLGIVTSCHERKISLTLCLFRWKTFCKDSFPHFPVFGSTKKTGQQKTIFSQWKILIKIRLVFYRLFSKKKNWKTISLSHIAFPINIIFVCSHDKHNFLAPSLSHGKISHFFSLPFTFSLLTPSLSLTLVSPLPIDLSLFSLISMFLYPSITQFSD